MLRLTRPAVPLCSQSLVRCFSAVPPAMAAGDTGSSTGRGSMAEKDQFIRREQANENSYVRQHEQEKMAALRAKMNEQEKHMKDLKKNVEGFTKDQGGKN